MRKAQHSSSVKEQHRIPEGFTLPMACMDTLPVLFFSISILILSSRFHSILFLIGALLIILAGALKVSWKFILALTKKDISLFNRQMRYLMPGGFLLILLSLAVDHQRWSPVSLVHHILTFPSVLFFLASIAGIIAMSLAAGHLDSHNAGNNWKEQTINTFTQFCIMMTILL